MGIVDSSYSLDTITKFSSVPHPPEGELLSGDDNTDDVMPIISEVTSVEEEKCTGQRTSTVTYGPICVRKRHTAAPTLATGRRSKDAFIVGEDIRKREVRRQKNRESARNLKRVRDNIERSLQTQVIVLESLHNHLLSEITNLRSYKYELEEKYNQSIIASSRKPQATCSSSANANQSARYVSVDQEFKEVKQEARSSSPQWQLLFSI